MPHLSPQKYFEDGHIKYFCSRILRLSCDLSWCQKVENYRLESGDHNYVQQSCTPRCEELGIAQYCLVINLRELSDDNQSISYNKQHGDEKTAADKDDARAWNYILNCVFSLRDVWLVSLSNGTDSIFTSSRFIFRSDFFVVYETCLHQIPFPWKSSLSSLPRFQKCRRYDKCYLVITSLILE